MNRRKLLLGALTFSVSSPALAAGECIQMSPKGPLCRVYVQSPVVIRQQCPEWCWAASASMIFAMHGHPVDQKRIVGRVFGGLACGTSASITIAQILSSMWVDDLGRPFQASVTAAYDIGNGIDFITNQFIIGELAANRPLLYGNSHHAMVLSQVDFVNNSGGPQVFSMGVFDPFPTLPPFHQLTDDEMRPAHEGGDMRFLAAVQIS